MFNQTEFASDQTCCARQAVSLFHFLYNVSLYRNRKEEHTMDSTRYFDALHNAMSAQHAGSQLLLTVQLLDACGKDAYLELRSLPGEQSLVLCYSTIGRRELDFQLFRKGWLQCHNADGQLTERFPSRADQLLEEVDFRAHCRDERLDATLSQRILQELKGLSGTDFQSRAAPPHRSQWTALWAAAPTGAIGPSSPLSACRWRRSCICWPTLCPAANAAFCRRTRRQLSWRRSGSRTPSVCFFIRRYPLLPFPGLLRPHRAQSAPVHTAKAGRVSSP